MKQILITGANGNLGGCLVKELTDNSEYGVIAVANNKENIFEMMDRENVLNRNKLTVFDQNDFFSSNCNVYACVHMAFSRANKPYRDIATSLDYSIKVFQKLKELGDSRMIYISSQSVYGSMKDWRCETCEPSPEIVYSMAKYAGEKLLEVASFERYSVLRLDYVIQSQKLVFALCKSAKETQRIKLKGGKQTFSYIDRTDVAKAIVALLNRREDWKHIYNVGPNKMRYTLMEIAKIVEKVAMMNGIDHVDIELEENETEQWSGMNSSLFMRDTGWKPSTDIYQMVNKIYQEV